MANQSILGWKILANDDYRRGRKCADIIGLAISDAKILIYRLQIKYTEAVLSNSARKLLWFEITKMRIAV